MRKIITSLLVVLLLSSSLSFAAASDIVSDGGGAVQRHFNLLGYRDLSGGCTDKFDKLLYVSGITAGMDPTALKVTMCKETGGDPTKVSSSNDYGLMQINANNTKGYSTQDLLSNVVLNVFVSTEIFYDKRGVVKTNSGQTLGNRGITVLEDSFSLFWGYNGFAQTDRGYADDLNPKYISLTKLSTSTRPLLSDNAYKVVDLSNLFTKTKRCGDICPDNAFNAFKVELAQNYKLYAGTELEEDAKNFGGGLLFGEVKVDSTYKPTYQDLLVKQEYSTDVKGLETKDDDYASYMFTTGVVKVINMGVAYLVYAVMMVVVIVWGLYLLHSLGFPLASKLAGMLTFGLVSYTHEKIFLKLVVASVFTLFGVALVVSGAIYQILSFVVLQLYQLFSF